jgi:hypothetical protein
VHLLTSHSLFQNKVDRFKLIKNVGFSLKQPMLLEISATHLKSQLPNFKWAVAYYSPSFSSQAFIA